MRKAICFILIVSVIFLLCSCMQFGVTEPAPRETTAPETHSMPTEESATDGTTVSTEPPHTQLYIPGVPVEDMIRYFNEVALSIEYNNGPGDPNLIQKWKYPIYYHIEGDPTDQDIAILLGLFDELNAIYGFPGIYPADYRSQANLKISFLDRENFRLNFSDYINGEEADGAVQFWYYTDTNEIYEAEIGYRTDISQEIRNSVLLEEIINALGLSDSELRSDSIVYQYGSSATALSREDWVIIQLLYHPDMACGMDADACKLVIEKIYN